MQNQTLVENAHKFCATIALTFLEGRTDCRSEIFVAGSVFMLLFLVSCSVPSFTRDT